MELLSSESNLWTKEYPWISAACRCRTTIYALLLVLVINIFAHYIFLKLAWIKTPPVENVLLEVTLTTEHLFEWLEFGKKYNKKNHDKNKSKKWKEKSSFIIRERIPLIPAF